jgi:hypothetical protein
MLVYQIVSLFFLLCTVTFRGPPQGSQSGPAFAKAGTGCFDIKRIWRSCGFVR